MTPLPVEPAPGANLVLLLVAALSVALLLALIRAFRGPRPAPAAPPAGGPNAVQQVFAGCGLFVLIPIGLLAVGLGLPAWQKMENSGHPPGWSEYAVVTAAVGLFLAVVVKLFRVLTARPVDRPPAPTNPHPSPTAPVTTHPRECPKCGQSVAPGRRRGCARGA